MGHGTAPLVVATAEALLQRTMPPETLDRAALTLKLEGQYSLDTLADQLTAAGYTWCDQVEGPGQFSSGAGFWMCTPPGGRGSSAGGILGK